MAVLVGALSIAGVGSVRAIGDPVRQKVPVGGFYWIASGVSIEEFASGSPTAPPVRVIRGHRTRLDDAHDVVVDPAGEIFVADDGPVTAFHNKGKILIFAPNAKGNVAPIGRIKGVNTSLDNPTTLAVRGHSLWVTDLNGGFGVLRFALSARGDVDPRQLIAGVHARGIAFVPGQAELWVSSGNKGHSLLRYSTHAHGNATPKAVIAGTNTGLEDPTRLTVDQQGEVIVANPSSSDEDPAAGNIEVFSGQATGNVAPLRAIPNGHSAGGVTMSLDNQSIVASNTDPYVPPYAAIETFGRTQTSGLATAAVETNYPAESIFLTSTR